MSEQEQTEQERQERVDICIKEVDEVFKKYRCHPVMMHITASNGVEKFELTAEIDRETQEIKA